MSKKVNNHNLEATTNSKTTKEATSKQAQKEALAELRKLVMAELGLR